MKSIHNLKRIDDELIYPLQKRLGLRAMTILARNTKRAALCKRTPIIALQMQQGKNTGREDEPPRRPRTHQGRAFELGQET